MPSNPTNSLQVKDLTCRFLTSTNSGANVRVTDPWGTGK
jgi:hypothetical protein